mmetsp:Transcript_37838/g.88469  ORF Transcript_37838/g.88469 Transcript_37838/m.88469 type:complete len:206 (-) Transcript_37838:590-1207(-)
MRQRAVDWYLHYYTAVVAGVTSYKVPRHLSHGVIHHEACDLVCTTPVNEGLAHSNDEPNQHDELGRGDGRSVTKGHGVDVGLGLVHAQHPAHNRDEPHHNDHRRAREVLPKAGYATQFVKLANELALHGDAVGLVAHLTGQLLVGFPACLHPLLQARCVHERDGTATLAWGDKRTVGFIHAADTAFGRAILLGLICLVNAAITVI